MSKSSVKALAGGWMALTTFAGPATAGDQAEPSAPVQVPPAQIALAPAAAERPRIAEAFPGGARGAPGVTSVLRWTEDWSDPSKADESAIVLQRLRHIPLGSDDVYLSLGGELRYNYTAWSHIDLGVRPNDRVTALQQRVRLIADLNVGSNLRAFVEVGDNQEFGSERPSPPNIDRWDVHQAFVDISVPIGDAKLSLRPGRFEMPIGSGKLIAVRDGANVRYLFEGVRGVYNDPGVVRIEAFSVQPVAIFPNAGDEADQTRSLDGIYVSTPRDRLISGVATDAYVLQADRDRVVYAGRTANDKRRSYGLRFWGRQGQLDYDLEGVLQRGEFGEQEIRGWGLMTEAGYTFTAQYSPRLGFRANAFSGDSDPADGRLETFSAPYPRAILYNDAVWFNFANLIDLFPHVTVRPTSTLTVTAGPHAMWRANTADAVYVGGASLPLIGPTNDDAYVGLNLSLLAEWQATNNLSFRANLVRFEASETLLKSGAQDSDYFGLWADLRF